MSVDEESWVFVGKAEQQVKEMFEEFNEHAPYGLEHRRQVSVEFKLTEDQLKEIVPILFGKPYEEVKRLTDPKNYTQHRP